MYRRQSLRWNGWGSLRSSFPLGEREAEFWDFVVDALGGRPLIGSPSVPIADVRIPASHLPESALTDLREIVGREHVRDDRRERAFHSMGRSYLDLIRLRRGELSVVPDAVVYPADHESVERVLGWCEKRSIAVIPFGGGSSVVGGVEALRGADHAGVVTLDTTRMDRLLALDLTSLTARFQTGVYGPVLQDALEAKGHTLGHYPQSFQFSTLGGWIAARGSGQQSARFGNAAAWLVAARVAAPTGTFETKPFPASAAGPDLNALIAGSEGSYGVITEATVRIRPRAEHQAGLAFLIRRWTDGISWARTIAQEGSCVSMLRLSDPTETAFMDRFGRVLRPSNLKRVTRWGLDALGYRDECALLLSLEGERGEVQRTTARLLRDALARGALYVGDSPVKSFHRNRFALPYLRDTLMERGVAVDTLETATAWAQLPALHQQVRSALENALREHADGGVVMAHVSHIYPAGGSLYYTFLFRQDLNRLKDQWQAIKRAASEAIVAGGGTISHHHGVGRDHREWLAAEKTRLGVDVLEGIKARLDPKGIMNPGKLIAGGDAH